jgi:signal transduction histidine kinase
MPDARGTTDQVDPVEAAADETEAQLIRGVRWRLVAWSGITTLVVLLVLATALYVAVARTLEETGVRQLTQRADEARAELLRPRPGQEPPGGLGFRFGGNTAGTFALAVLADGRPLVRPDVIVPAGLPDQASLTAAREGGRDVRLGEVDGEPVRVLTEPILAGGDRIFLQVVQLRTAEEQTLRSMLAILLAGGAVVVLVAFGFGTVYARRALVPIRESLASQRAALRRQREFAADASHELRAPLTVVRSNVEHLRRHQDQPVRAVGDAIDDIDAEVTHLTSLVDDLLLLARSDSGAISLERRPVDLGDVAAHAASALSKAAEAKGIAVTVDPEPAVVVGDEARLRQLVMILVDNAIKHTPAGGSVRVLVRGEGADAALAVEDDGPGVRPEDMPRIFERFWRAPGSTSDGNGLGLAIAAWIVERHRGRIGVSNRQPTGARFDVRLPTAPATAS